MCNLSNLSSKQFQKRLKRDRRAYRSCVIVDCTIPFVGLTSSRNANAAEECEPTMASFWGSVECSEYFCSNRLMREILQQFLTGRRATHITVHCLLCQKNTEILKKDSIPKTDKQNSE